MVFRRKKNDVLPANFDQMLIAYGRSELLHERSGIDPMKALDVYSAVAVHMSDEAGQAEMTRLLHPRALADDGWLAWGVHRFLENFASSQQDPPTYQEILRHAVRVFMSSLGPRNGLSPGCTSTRMSTRLFGPSRASPRVSAA